MKSLNEKNQNFPFKGLNVEAFSLLNVKNTPVSIPDSLKLLGKAGSLIFYNAGYLFFSGARKCISKEIKTLIRIW